MYLSNIVTTTSILSLPLPSPSDLIASVEELAGLLDRQSNTLCPHQTSFSLADPLTPLPEACIPP